MPDPFPSVVKAVHELQSQWPTLDPFLFCAHHHDSFPAGVESAAPPSELMGRSIGQDFSGRDGWSMYHGESIPGFPSHPHRGFETVTLVREGLVDHADSQGAAGRYGEGDVQWMTAGSGLQHSEMFPLVNQSEPNPLHLFQLWMNLPAANKMVDPHFSMFWQKQVPVVESEGVRVELIAGEYQGQQAPTPPPSSWAAESKNNVLIWVISLEPGTHWSLPADEKGLNRMLYYYEGQGLSLEGHSVSLNSGLELDSAESLSLSAGGEACNLLLLQGRPINEPVAHYGPFVMNSREQLQQAFEEYQRTQFGGWPWPSTGPVHGVNPRFARYADGSEDGPESPL